MSTPERLVCTQCGSTDVTEDATVAWDISNQRWDVVDISDYQWCSECDSETNAEWLPVVDVKALAQLAIKKENQDGI